MRRPKPLIWLLLLLTAANVGMFLFRDHFTYVSYARRAELYGDCDPACWQKWKQFALDYPEAELAEAKRIGDSVVGDEREEGTKVLLLARFLYTSFHEQEGNPSADLLRASPLQQFLRLRHSKSEALWCGNYSSMMAYFCWAQGIPSRVVGVLKPGDQHVLNECYLASAGRWVMVDITSDRFLVADRQGKWLDFQEVKARLLENDTLAAAGSSGSVERLSAAVPVAARYYLADAENIYYHRVDNAAAYRFGEKLKRYVWPVSWYDIYATEGKWNLGFWLKTGLLLSWLLVFFVFCIRQTKFKL